MCSHDYDIDPIEVEYHYKTPLHERVFLWLFVVFFVIAVLFAGKADRESYSDLHQRNDAQITNGYILNAHQDE